MILAMRTDKPESELYLFSGKSEQIDEIIWRSDRRLADELLPQIQELIGKNDTSLEDLKGIIVFTGEGSFTGLRIGTTVANTLAYSLNIPIADSSGTDWLKTGLEKLKTTKPSVYVLPKYSSEANITRPKNS